MAEREFDLVVVGEGVAASAALIALGPASARLKIAVVAPDGDRPAFRIGEHLSANGNTALRELGLWEGFAREGYIETQSSYSAWGSPRLEERNAFGDPRGAGWSLDRVRFDEWLREQAREHCRFVRIPGMVKDVDAETGAKAASRLEIQGGELIWARFTLDGSGRAAALARRLTGRSRRDRLVAVYRCLEQVENDIEPTPGPLVEALPSGWLYSALLPGRRLAVALFTDGDLASAAGGEDRAASGDREAAWRDAVEAGEFTRRRLETAGFAPDARVMSTEGVADASVRLSDIAAGDGWAAMGDAAAAFDPLSSHGLSTALWAGRRAALAAVNALDGDDGPLTDYADAVAAGVARFLEQRKSIYALERRFESEPFWRRRRE